jgi:hypothetical protein
VARSGGEAVMTEPLYAWAVMHYPKPRKSAIRGGIGTGFAGLWGPVPWAGKHPVRTRYAGDDALGNAIYADVTDIASIDVMWPEWKRRDFFAEAHTIIVAPHPTTQPTFSFNLMCPVVIGPGITLSVGIYLPNMADEARPRVLP